MAELMASPPDVLRWEPRGQGHGDCAIAALALACGVTYEIALAAVLGVCANALIEGLDIKEVKLAATHLGFKVRISRKYDLEDDTGILFVEQPHVKDSGHAVYLWEGRIIEPKHDRQQLWLEAQAFLSHYKYKAKELIRLEREE